MKEKSSTILVVEEAFLMPDEALPDFFWATAGSPLLFDFASNTGP